MNLNRFSIILGAVCLGTSLNDGAAQASPDAPYKEDVRKSTCVSVPQDIECLENFNPNQQDLTPDMIKVVLNKFTPRIGKTYFYTSTNIHSSDYGVSFETKNGTIYNFFLPNSLPELPADTTVSLIGSDIVGESFIYKYAMRKPGLSTITLTLQITDPPQSKSSPNQPLFETTLDPRVGVIGTSKAIPSTLASSGLLPSTSTLPLNETSTRSSQRALELQSNVPSPLRGSPPKSSPLDLNAIAAPENEASSSKSSPKKKRSKSLVKTMQGVFSSSPPRARGISPTPKGEVEKGSQSSNAKVALPHGKKIDLSQSPLFAKKAASSSEPTKIQKK
jgi:hypothetical protein